MIVTKGLCDVCSGRSLGPVSSLPSLLTTLPWLSNVRLLHTYVHTVNDGMWPCAVTDKSEYDERWPIANELLKDLPSNQLQSHRRGKYIGDTIYHSKEGREGGRE